MHYFLFLILFLTASISTANELPVNNSKSFSSSSERVALVELYTSEGCSSCPPADEWLSELTSSEKLWKRFVPVAFHVDYWNYLGWNDRFSTKEYSQRQRQYAREKGEDTVYTPGVRIGGQEFRAWRNANQLENLEIGSDVGVLKLSVKADGSFIARFDSSIEAYQSTQLNVALLGMNLLTEVERGENRGRQLKHDFVVLDLKTYDSSNNQFSGELPKTMNKGARLAVAAWVDNKQSQIPIQVVGGLL